MGRLILNCDLGEDEPLELTEQILSLVDAANIGCGFHAGSPEKTRATIELARKYQVMIGAHPGISLEGGRGKTLPDYGAFRELLEKQIGGFQASARSVGATINYIKLHGSLYHAVNTQAALANVFIDFLKEQSPKLAVFALAGAAFARKAEAAGLHVYHEAFADRDYLSDGSLRPRDQAGAVLAEKEALSRLQIWIEQGAMPTSRGPDIRIKASTLCVHGDSSEALAMIQNIRNSINEN
jgi:UPF0271 protein